MNMLTNKYIKHQNGNIAPLAAAVIFGILATIISVSWMTMKSIDTVVEAGEDWQDTAEETKDDLMEAVAGFGLAIVLVAVIFLFRGKKEKAPTVIKTGQVIT
jgi:hypothetical protein